MDMDIMVRRDGTLMPLSPKGRGWLIQNRDHVGAPIPAPRPCEVRIGEPIPVAHPGEMAANLPAMAHKDGIEVVTDFGTRFKPEVQ